jgi:hypothetical protein
MRNLLVAVVVVVAAVIGLGVWRGWLEFGGTKQDGKVQGTVNLEVDKFKNDKERVKELLVKKSKDLKEQLAALGEKAAKLSGEAKATLDKEIAALSKKLEAVESKIKALQTTTQEKFEEFRKRNEGNEGTDSGSK